MEEEINSDIPAREYSNNWLSPVPLKGTPMGHLSLLLASDKNRKSGVDLNLETSVDDKYLEGIMNKLNTPAEGQEDIKDMETRTPKESKINKDRHTAIAELLVGAGLYR